MIRWTKSSNPIIPVHVLEVHCCSSLPSSLYFFCHKASELPCLIPLHNMAHQADYTSARSCMLPSQIDKNRVNARGCHLYLQKPYVPFPDCLSLGLFSCGLPLISPLILSVSRFPLSRFIHASIICLRSPFPSIQLSESLSSLPLSNGGCCSLSVLQGTLQSSLFCACFTCH